MMEVPMRFDKVSDPPALTVYTNWLASKPTEYQILLSTCWVKRLPCSYKHPVVTIPEIEGKFLTFAENNPRLLLTQSINRYLYSDHFIFIDYNTELTRIAFSVGCGKNTGSDKYWLRPRTASVDMCRPESICSKSVSQRYSDKKRYTPLGVWSNLKQDISFSCCKPFT